MEAIDIELLSKVMTRAAPKSNEFHILRAVLPTLPLEDVVHLMDFSFNQKKHITELFVSYLQNQWDASRGEQYATLLDQIEARMAELTSYLPLYRGAVVASTILKLIGNPEGPTERYTRIMLDSPYLSIRNLGYDILQEHYSTKYKEHILRNWHKYSDERIIDIVVSHGQDFVETTLPEEMIGYFEPDDPRDFVPLQDLIQRNLLVSIFALRDRAIAERYKEKDPISYIFICKTDGFRLEPDLVMNQFRNNERTRRYLPSWMAEAGEFQIINLMMKQLESELAGAP